MATCYVEDPRKMRHEFNTKYVQTLANLSEDFEGDLSIPIPVPIEAPKEIYEMLAHISRLAAETAAADIPVQEDGSLPPTIEQHVKAVLKAEVIKLVGKLDEPLGEPTAEGAQSLLKIYHASALAEYLGFDIMFHCPIGNTLDALRRQRNICEFRDKDIDLHPVDDHLMPSGILGDLTIAHIQPIQDSPQMQLEAKIEQMLRHHLLGICFLGLHGIERWEPIYATSFEELEQLAPGRRAKIRAPKYENWLRITICDKSFRNPGLFKAWQESLFKDHPEWAPEILTSLVGTMFEETDFEPENYQKMVSCLASGLRQAEVDLDKIAAAYIQAGQPEALLRSRLELE